tara:strand:- start:79 stop:354 length:276 start_codon:yes stop_codon:yes gene_type:complete
VEVSLRAEEGQALLRASDDGPGIPPEERAALFAFGTQSVDAKPGSGLGLQSAHRVALTHGGRIWAEESTWGGAALHASLPLAEEEEPPAAG